MPPPLEEAGEVGLTTLSDGRRVATEELVPIVYENLRRLAASFFQGEEYANTLQPTALVHEAYIKLVDQKVGGWENRAQFLSVAGTVMRRVLVDAARARRSVKRGGEMHRVTLHDDISTDTDREVDILDLDVALEKLSKVKERFVRIAELHYFSGLTLIEVAKVLDVSRATITHEWAQARAWLAVEMGLPRKP